MTPAEYQAFTPKTAVFPKDRALEYLTTALASEAGEVAGAYAKYVRGDFGPEELASRLEKELGDVLYNISEICNAYGWTFEDLMRENAFKLSRRLMNQTLRGDGDNR